MARESRSDVHSDPVRPSPTGFLWGVGTSAHQTEGGNTRNDWHEWESSGHTNCLSGIACDSWNRYREDHRLAYAMGCNAYRMSLEWSRIEPEEGGFSKSALEHYREVLRDIGSLGMNRTVTLNHWTVPSWFARRYGWHHGKSSDLFRRFTDRVMRALGGEVDMVLTLNEPRLFLNRGYFAGDRPPGFRFRADLYLRARRHLVEAHRRSYESIKSFDSDIQVGLTQFVNGFDFFQWGNRVSFLTDPIDRFYNWQFLDCVSDSSDFIGLNYYFDVEVRFRRPFIRLKVFRSGMAEGLRDVLTRAWIRYGKPLYVFENGVPDDTDEVRSEFIRAHVAAIRAATDAGADVRGYYHWSLLDSYEWDAGYSMRFGLYGVDRRTLERRARPAVETYRRIIQDSSQG